MKLVIAVVQNKDADTVVDALVAADYRATRFASTGGFLRRGNTTIMIGVQDQQVDQIIDIIRDEARGRPDEADDSSGQAAATVFVLDLEEYQRL